jgi:hypothetical protein
VRGFDFFRGTFGNDLKGTQIDAFAGLTRRLTSNFVVGVLGGYEHFDYSSQAFNGVLKGDGWTAGAFLGWKLSPNMRFDAGAAWSDLLANGVSGTARGSFLGARWLVQGGLTGTYPWQSFVLEPSARVFALWERLYRQPRHASASAQLRDRTRERRHQGYLSLRLDELGGAISLCGTLCRLLFLAR